MRRAIARTSRIAAAMITSVSAGGCFARDPLVPGLRAARLIAVPAALRGSLSRRIDHGAHLAALVGVADDAQRRSRGILGEDSIVSMAAAAAGEIVSISASSQTRRQRAYPRGRHTERLAGRDDPCLGSLDAATHMRSAIAPT